MNEEKNKFEPLDTDSIAREAVKKLATDRERPTGTQPTKEIADYIYKDDLDIISDSYEPLADEKARKAVLEPLEYMEADYKEYVESIRPKPRARPRHTDSPAYKTNKTYSSLDIEDPQRELYVSSAIEELESFADYPEPPRNNLNLNQLRIPILAGSVAILLIFTFLIVKINKTTSERDKAVLDMENNQVLVERATATEIDNETLEAEILLLEKENAYLKAENRKYIGGLEGEGPVEGAETTGTPVAPSPENPTLPATTAASAKTHTVVAGDNFWTIGEKYYNNGLKGDEIMARNGYTNPASLQIGDVLNLP